MDWSKTPSQHEIEVGMGKWRPDRQQVDLGPADLEPARREHPLPAFTPGGSSDGDSLNRYLREISGHPLLTREEEVDVARRIRTGCEEALDTLVQSNLRFVVSIARRYRNHGVSLADLISEGNLGLIRAARRFDETKGIKFISYAVWWIRQAIFQALTEQGSIVRIPHNQAGTQSHLSLDAPLAPDQDTNLMDCLPDTQNPGPDEEMLEHALAESIERALATLKEREAKILRLYFGLGSDGPMTLEEIGGIYGITRERVRQIKAKALWRLKRESGTRALQSFLM